MSTIFRKLIEEHLFPIFSMHGVVLALIQRIMDENKVAVVSSTDMFFRCVERQVLLSGGFFLSADRHGESRDASGREAEREDEVQETH
jgi:hypothetical protein